MAEKINTSKIIVDQSDELTDIVREIHKSKAERIVLTFTEQTDLLISPINLRVLLESAHREKKLLIAQIIQNPTGVRNAKLAGLKVIETPSSPVESDWEDALELIVKQRESKKEKKESIKDVGVKEERREVFEEKVQHSVEEKNSKGYVDRRGLNRNPSFVSIDTDIPKRDTPVEKIFPNRDFAVKGEVSNTKTGRVNIFEKLKGLNRRVLLKRSLFVLLPILLIIVIGLVLYNQFATLVKVKIFVAAKPVEIEQVLTGQEGIEEIDFENLKIPIKTESASQSLSDSINATGKAFRGDKATGSVRLTFYYKEDDCPVENSPKVTLGVGHIIRTGELAYKLTASAEILCNQMADVQVEATDIGKDYNIQAGKRFSVDSYSAGYSQGEVIGLNSAAFTGGSEEEYTVLSQQDVDNAVEQLSITAIEEVKSDLRDRAKGWEIIEDTILSEVDTKSIKTDKSVGQEASTVNLDLSIKGSATYYLATGLSDALAELLQNKAEEEKLFESDKDLELVLGDEIDKDISIENAEGGSVKIKIVAKSMVKPKVDKTKLEDTLRGMKWEKGKEHVNGLRYSERKPEVTFTPMNYPEFLKRFPDRKGGVMVQIVELEVEE